MNSSFFTYHQSIIAYKRYGTGSRLLFCFHGYGENGETFELMESFIGNDFVLIALDLPFHGDTKWNENFFEPQQLKEIVLAIAGNVNRFSLTGFSLGGRIALQLLQLIPDKIERVVLFAPDGFHKNFWYRFVTQSNFGNRIFRYLMKHPLLLFVSMRLSKASGLLNATFFKIAHYYLNDPAERKLLYKRWTCLRNFRPDLQKISGLIKKDKIQLKLVFGAYDKVILSRSAQSFINGIEDHATIYEIEAGHGLLKEKYAATIASFFYD